MKKLVLLVIVLLVNYNLFAQDFWQLTNQEFNADKIVIANSGKLLASNYDGLFFSNDAGQTWLPTNFTSIINDFISIDDSIIIIGNYTGVYVSNDSGENWLKTATCDANSLFYDTLANVIYLGTLEFPSFPSGVYTSSDLGNSWQLLHEFYSSGSQYAGVLDVVVSKQNNIIFAYFVNRDWHHDFSMLYRSVDSGINWEENFGYSIEDILENCNSIFYIITYYQLFISTDFGTTWTAKNIQADKIRSDMTGKIYYNTGYIIECSDENGENLTTIGQVLPQINDITIDQNNKIYVATEQGIYTGNGNDVILSISKENLVNQLYFLSQNYPNPFNPNTNIQYAISSRQFVTLKVFDVLGKEVATLVDEYRNAGSYEVEFKSSAGSLQLASGIYYYQLKAGDFIETKKMILMK